MSRCSPSKTRITIGIRIDNTTYGTVLVIVCDYYGTRIHSFKDGNYGWAGVSTTPGQRMAILPAEVVLTSA